MNSVAVELANKYHAPLSIILNANTAQVSTSTTAEAQVTFSMIPTALKECRYVTVMLGQDIAPEIGEMQVSLTSKTPVGNIGAALGCLSAASVAECIGWVQKFNVANYFAGVEFGFGDSTVSEGKLANMTKYEALSSTQIDKLDSLGYVFFVKYAGLEGNIYFSSDQTCSSGDYRTIARNRAIHKSRRLIRSVLLPYVNSPIKVNPATGFLSPAQITIFRNDVTNVLQAMSDAEEISGFSVNIPTNQNVLTNDKVAITYKIVPVGTSKFIEVTEGLSLTQ